MIEQQTLIECLAALIHPEREISDDLQEELKLPKTDSEGKAKYYFGVDCQSEIYTWLADNIILRERLYD